MKVLIVVQDASLGSALGETVQGDGTEARILVIDVEGAVIAWTTEGSEPSNLPESVAEATFIIVSHPSGDLASEIQRLAVNKHILGLSTSSTPIALSSMPLSWFKGMWPEIERVIRAKSRADS